jgi:hypothetical protein
MGAIGGHGADFGSEDGDDFGSEFGDDDDDDELDDYGAEFGDDDDDWDDYGSDFGAAVATKTKKKAVRPGMKMPAHLAMHPAMNRRPSQQALANLWRARAVKAVNTASRTHLLEPNKHSKVKVEKYTFPLSQAIVLGTAVAFTTLSGQPDTSIRPQRVTCNAPAPMFAYLQEIKVANVSVTVGSGLEDAYAYNANGVGQSLDMPTLSPANRATVLGSYTGFVPPGYVQGSNQYFTVSFKGPASIVA